MSKAERKRAKKKRARNRGVDPRSIPRDEIARPLRMVLEAADQYEHYIKPAETLADAEAASLADACDAGRRLATAAEPYDVFDVLEYVRLNESWGNPETYRETEHEGSAALIELVATILATRGHREGTATADGGHRAGPEPAMEEILAQARAAMDAGSVYLALSSLTGSPNASFIGLGAVLREVFVRNLAYVHMMEDTLTDLFGVASVEAGCRASLGCTVAEIRQVFRALNDLHEDEWNLRFQGMRDLMALARREIDKSRRVTAEKDAEPAGPDIADDTRAEASAMWDRTWADPADCSTFDLARIAQAASLPEATVTAVVNLFASDMAANDPADAVKATLNGQSTFRTRPLLRDPSGEFVVVHGGLLVPAIRERIEEALKSSAVPRAWDDYAAERGKYLEGEALRQLDAVLPGSVVHSGFEYFVPDPLASTPQTTPASYTKLVEGDGLLVVDDVALIVEAKAGALTPLSRSGDPAILERDLKRIVTAAADQIDRLRERITADGGVRMRDGTWLALDHVREIHGIAVSLDDLSGIATITSHLVEEGLLPHSQLPWTVSLHDLRIISELVDRPAELVLYLRRRTEPDVTRRYHAVDELDFFLEFYATGLYVEPDPDRVEQELPQFGQVPVRDRRRFRAQGLEILLSRTDRLDAWYMRQLGIRKTPADKPTISVNADLLELVDALATLAEPGWLTIGATLMEGNSPTRKRFATYGAELCSVTDEDGRPHTAAVLGGTRREQSFVLVWASRAPWESVDDATARLAGYASAKKHQAQVAFGAGLLFDPASRSLARTTYDSRAPGVDPVLDAEVIRLGLKPVDSRGADLRRQLAAIRGKAKKAR